MSNLRYLKGVRTRFSNILEKEVNHASLLLNTTLSEANLEELLHSVSLCIGKLQAYSVKLENQSEKVTAAIDEQDETAIEQILEEDSELCNTALTLVTKLQGREFHLKERLNEEKQMNDTMHTTSGGQTDIQKILEMQLELQKELLKNQKSQQPKQKTAVKLPKLELHTFNGGKIKWIEFWQSFETSVHNNENLSNIEKFNYLRSKLSGEARSAITGLCLSNENYEVAINILKERFGNVQKTVDLHYNRIINLKPSNESVDSLRYLLDTLDKHLRSLEVLKQNVNQDLFVSIMKSKLPTSVIRHMEIQKGKDENWTVVKLKKILTEYVVACEKAEKAKKENVKQTFSRNYFGPKLDNQKQNDLAYNHGINKGSAEAFAVNDKANSHQQSKSCRYCSKSHWSDECPRFRTIKERRDCLKGSCYKCLKEGQMSNECKSKRVCVYCKQINVHHRSLCPQKFRLGIKQGNVHISDEVVDVSPPIPKMEENALLSSSEIVLMQTARAEVKSLTDKQVKSVRILLDSGSQRTYLTERLANYLHLERKGEQEIRLNTFGSEKSKLLRTDSTEIKLQLIDGEEMNITANIVPNIAGTIQRRPLNIANRSSFNSLIGNLSLADSVPTELETDTIDLLIGSDFYLDIILGHKIEIQPGLYLLSSKLGWILTGRTNIVNDEKVNDISMLILTYGTNIVKTEVMSNVDKSVHTMPDLDDFWNIESLGIKEEMKSNDDEEAVKKFENTLIFKDDRYYVTWPWKSGGPEFPENRALAVGRLRSLVTKLKDKPDMMKKYDSVIEDQLAKGMIEKVEGKQRDGIRHYMPHHAVVKPDHTTTKLRIVYDASAKTRLDNKSLNECLYRGPVLLHDLCGILIRFRLNKIGIVSDIEKAFLNIGLQKSERDVTRFLWLKNSEHLCTSTDNIQEYRFCRIPFGIICSPFLLGATVDCHLKSYDTEIANQLRRDIYMDNVITGTDCVSDAITLYESSKQMLSEASLNLREWTSNSEYVNENIRKEDRANGEIIKVLGLTWNKKHDTLSLKSVVPSNVQFLSKRVVLKDIASVFDPLGLFSPVTLKGKLFLQNLWKKQLDWDTYLEEEDINIWMTIRDDICSVSEFEVQRCVLINDAKQAKNILLCFCDASGKAYAATIYLMQQIENKRKIELIFTKTRLAPIKNTTIPRLELMAVLIGVRCIAFVQVQLHIQVHEIHLFSDSKCTLSWITSTKQLPVFVSNRVKEINSHKDIEFHYVSTKSNPADIASRGCSLSRLIGDNAWWHGPEWLLYESQDWPIDEITKEEKEVVQNEIKSELNEKEIQSDKKITVCLATNDDQKTSSFSSSVPLEIDCERFSSATKLLRVTALVLRFIRKLKGEKFPQSNLMSKELEEAEKMWVIHAQRKDYEDIFKSIIANKKHNLQSQLGVYIDKEGILRCRGRLEHAELTEAAKFPILLPKNNRFTHLIIEREHKRLLHSGISQTLSLVRHKYWIPHGRSTVRKAVNKCLICRRTEGGPFKMPIMAPFPQTRVSESSPFAHTGIDYMGPLYIKEQKETEKVWICLFTCMVTRAVHLELVSDMTTVAFLNCLRRFISCRGTPNDIVSDNAKHFKLANETMKLVWKNIIQSEEVQSYSANVGINWIFIVELAPWMGGFYERLVGIVKKALRKAIGKKLLNKDQLSTVIKEAEAVVNSRPLVYVGDDINSNLTITPAHFISLNPKTGIPECDIQNDDEDFILQEKPADKIFKIWKKGQKLLDAFWNIWREEYLISLRERTQTVLKQNKTLSRCSPSIGNVVLIKENLPRGCWKLGNIVELVYSADGNIRSAKVQVSTGRILGRPLCLLYPIETSESIKNVLRVDSSNDSLQVRPCRQAATEAKIRIKECVKKCY